jgi:hypothetical protein
LVAEFISNAINFSGTGFRTVSLVTSPVARLICSVASLAKSSLVSAPATAGRVPLFSFE